MVNYNDKSHITDISNMAFIISSSADYCFVR